MPKRDKTGKFVKDESEGFKFILTFPPLKKIICWVFIFIVLLPWLCIAFKFDILNLILEKMEELLMKSDRETSKKNGLFG